VSTTEFPGTAADRWRADLLAWAIPDEILSKAPEDPWSFPVELFVARAEASTERLTFSNEAALVALPEGGTVLDVGCGAGGASMPLARRAGLLIGVDSGEEMLAAFAEQAANAGVQAHVFPGRWPDVGPDVPPADVAVCHHVAYNAPDLASFALALTDHARGRVVMELTTEHPLSRLAPLWLRFHALRRPDRPTAMDAVLLLREAGLDVMWQQWTAPRGGGFRRKEDLVAWVRRQLCLPKEREPEVAEALEERIEERDGLYGFQDRPVVTVWWAGRAFVTRPTGGPARSAPAGSDG
jgi:SAM-dependent methyltransferase